MADFSEDLLICTILDTNQLPLEKSYNISQPTNNTGYFPKWLISETLFIYTILETNRLELEKFHEGCVKFGEARNMGGGKRDEGREKKRKKLLKGHPVMLGPTA